MAFPEIPSAAQRGNPIVIQLAQFTNRGRVLVSGTFFFYLLKLIFIIVIPRYASGISEEMLPFNHLWHLKKISISLRCILHCFRVRQTWNQDIFTPGGGLSSLCF